MFSVSGEEGSEMGSTVIPKGCSTLAGDLSAGRLSKTSPTDCSKSIWAGPSAPFKLESEEDGCVVSTRVFNREIISSSEFETRRVGLIFVKTGGSSATVGF